MLTRRRIFDKDFKLLIIKLINSGHKVSKISVDYSLNDAMIRKRKKGYINLADPFLQEMEL